MCESAALTFFVSFPAGDSPSCSYQSTFSVLQFLGEFAKISESACYLHDVCPSVRMEQLSCHWRILMKIDILVFFENLSRYLEFD